MSVLELEEASLVFGPNLDYDRVWIYEEAAWPDWLGKLGAWLRRQDPPAHNAITLGNRMFFPTRLESDHPQAKIRRSQTAWLIHELTHVWQYQHFGWRYLVQALWVLLRHGEQAYHVGSQDTLTKASKAGAKLKDFNREQQGELARGYYLRMKTGQDVEAWEKYIKELRNNP